MRKKFDSANLTHFTGIEQYCRISPRHLLHAIYINSNIFN